jgi:hypothetical protein
MRAARSIRANRSGPTWSPVFERTGSCDAWEIVGRGDLDDQLDQLLCESLVVRHRNYHRRSTVKEG